MGIYAVVIATICYLTASYDNIKQGDYPHALMWFAYALANTALIWYEYDKTKNGSG